MKKLILALLLLPSLAFADTSTFTFSIASSASTATPNLRIAKMKPVMAQFPQSAQAFVWDETSNHYLTKSTTISYNSVLTKVIKVQADQDTKVYLGSDLTNYILIKADIDELIVLR